MALVALGGNRWQFQAELGRDPLTRRRRRKTTVFEGTRRQADRAHALFLAETATEEPSANATLSRLLVEWLDFKRQLSPTTRQEYRRLIGTRIGPALGDVPLRKLSAWDLDRFYSALERSGLAPGTVRQCHAILRGALEQAKRWRWVPSNVALEASPPAMRRRPVRPPTFAAVQMLAAAADRCDPELATAAVLAVMTGARRGELCALRRSAVDLDLGRILIRYSVAEVRGEGSIVKDTKTHAERVVAVDADTVAMLKLHFERQEERARIAEVTLDPDPYVLSRSFRCDRPWTPSNLSAAWAALCRANGAAGVRFHDLRHFSVTALLDAGVPLPVVAKRHGHLDGNVTLGIYGHAVDGRDEAAAQVIRRTLNP